MTTKTLDKLIPWYFVLFFVVLTCIYSFFMTIAHDTYPGVVTEKAYDKGLKYNDTIARAEQQEHLGWKGVIASDTTAKGEAHVVLTLTDAAAKPVTGAKVTLWFQRPVKEGMDEKAAMKEIAPGAYEATTALKAKGLWEVSAAAEAEGKSFQVSKKVTFQ
jgi:nitrogen fixation protein FixH